jgi:hypothetical protein
MKHADLLSKPVSCSFLPPGCSKKVFVNTALAVDNSSLAHPASRVAWFDHSRETNGTAVACHAITRKPIPQNPIVKVYSPFSHYRVKPHIHLVTYTPSGVILGHVQKTMFGELTNSSSEAKRGEVTASLSIAPPLIVFQKDRKCSFSTEIPKGNRTRPLSRRSA